MKTLLIILIFSAASVTQIFAQQRGAGTYGAHQLIIQYADELGLSEDQKKEIATISLEARQQFRGTARGQRGSLRGTRADGRRTGIQRGESTRFERQTGQRQPLNTEILGVLNDQQMERLSSIMTERAENAHEFRTLRNQLMVSNAGIEGEKAARVLEILNQRSELQLDWAKQRISGTDTEEFDRDAWSELQAETRQLNVDLRNLLTVTEYQQLMGYWGSQRLEARSQERRPRRGNR